MSKALSSISSKEEQTKVIKRRLKGCTGGLGYLAARDAARKLGITIPTKQPVDIWEEEEGVIDGQ